MVGEKGAFEIPPQRMNLDEAFGMRWSSELSAGRPEIIVGLIDGLVAMNHPDLAVESIRKIPGKPSGRCTQAESAARVRETLMRGILCAMCNHTPS